MARSRQAVLPFGGRGGRRAGTGRKPLGAKAGVPHCRRPVHDRGHPVHVTLRAIRDISSLRSPRMFPLIRCAIAAASAMRFRVAHFSVQGNHVHLLIEADGTEALARGMQGLGIRLAKVINRQLGRRGRVWADRYHGRVLRTPQEVRHALVYVLLNGRKHGVSGSGIDPCSSGAWFRGWRERTESPPGPAPVAQPRTWLLLVGWRRSGAVSLDDRPARSSRRARRDRPCSPSPPR
jgi:REP element-mobilizing transposase RayT